MFLNYKELSDNLAPVVDAVQWINTTKRFVLYVGGIAASIAAVITLSKQ
jgi:hypothetical protein